MDLKAIYHRYKGILQPVMYAKNRVFSLRISGGKGNRVEGIQQCRMKDCRIAFHGTGNTVQIGDMSTLYGVRVEIFGNDNRITLGSRSNLYGCAFSIEDNGNEITVGDHTYIHNGTELAAIEGTRIDIGAEGLISSNVMIRTGDSHSILENGRRINPSGSITVGEHVWIGKGAVVLKQARIARDCVIGTGAVITGKTEEKEGTIFVGSPARATRSGITWDQDRLPV